MPISQPYSIDGVSISTTEISIISGTSTLQNASTAGVYMPFVDGIGAAMAKGDIFQFRVYEKCLSGSAKKVVNQWTLAHAQSQIHAYPHLLLLHGFDFTLKKDVGTDRNFDASIRAMTGAQVTQYDSMSAVTVGATELSIVSGTTTLQTVTDDGLYQLFIDPANMAKGDSYEVSCYERVEPASGTKRLLWREYLQDVYDGLWVSPVTCMVNGWDYTIRKIAGTDRAFDASIRRAA